MRKLISSIVLVGTALLMLLPVQPVQPVQRVRAQTNAVYYTVRYACIVSPDMRGSIEGQWVLDCNGKMTGWGWEPGHNCTYTEMTYQECGGGGGPDPGPFVPDGS